MNAIVKTCIPWAFLLDVTYVDITTIVYVFIIMFIFSTDLQSDEVNS